MPRIEHRGHRYLDVMYDMMSQDYMRYPYLSPKRLYPNGIHNNQWAFYLEIAADELEP